MLKPDHVASFSLLTLLNELRKVPRSDVLCRGASPAVTVWSVRARTPTLDPYEGQR